MNSKLRIHADKIINEAVSDVLPDKAVAKALDGTAFDGRILLVAVGKAAWQMAKAARDALESRIDKGIIITKYGHAKEPIENILCCEAGHPVPDESSFLSTQLALDMVSDLTAQDTVLFLLSGGGSALFEKPLISGEELQDITSQLLACGADIVEINTIRKRLSAVKGGKFAGFCAPARVYSVVLSDIIGAPLDMIASGPACPDSSTCSDALKIAEKYKLRLSERTMECLKRETPKQLDNITVLVTGSVKALCSAAASAAEGLGYEAHILTDMLCCQARDAGSILASIAKTHCSDGRKLAFIAGGETVVRLTGCGKGGRNQELVLSAAIGIDGLSNVCIFSVGSDGTDGPTDAAGGYVDGDTACALRDKSIDIHKILQQNDSYTALKAVDGLIFTGPTGTNVNDVSVLLIDL